MMRFVNLLIAILGVVLEMSLLFSVGAVEDVSLLMEKQRIFADELVSKLYQNSNECTSALGISMAFSLIYPSATGTSLSEIQSILGYPSSETNLQLVWNETQTQLETEHNGECFFYVYPDNIVCEDMAPMVGIGNSVWVPIFNTNTTAGETVGLVPEYQQVLGDYVFPIDFSDSGAGALINDWVNASTKGLIDSIVDDGPVDQLFTLLAVNSIYLKAQWASPFYNEFSNEDVFYTSLERTEATDSKARFMHKVDYMEYSSTAIPGIQLFKLDFHRGNGLSMIFALPGSAAANSGTDTGTSVTAKSATNNNNMVKSQDVWSALDSLQEQRIALALPMFNFESMYESILMSSLQEMGLNAPFMGELCIYDNNLCQEMISMILQKTVINVNELGVEAAAVTAIMTTTSEPPPETPVLVMMDHPFQFFLLDTNQQVVLFEGQVGNPGISQDASAEPAKLEAQHANADFWLTNFNVEPILPEFGSASSPAPNGDDTQGNDTVSGDSDDSSGNDNKSTSHAIRLFGSSSVGTINWIVIMVMVSTIALALGFDWMIQAL